MSEHTHRDHLALPQSGKGAGVLVLHAWWGLNVQQSKAAYLGHFAETDPYMSEEEKEQFEDSLKALNRPTTFFTYPGTGHWFMESDRPDTYSPQAAQLAWERTIAFLHEQLEDGSDPTSRSESDSR